MSVEQEQGSTWKCGCGAARKPWRNYCPACTRAQRATHGDKLPEAQRRANARSYLNQYVRRGKIAKQPCAECGAAEVEAHHADYNQPLAVTWLCRACHLKLHGVVLVRRVRATGADHGKPAELYAFYRSLRERGVTTELLAATIGVSGGTLRKKIGGLSAHRGPVWRALLALLTPEEVSLLDTASRTDWAKTQSAKRPRWTFEKAAQLAMSTAA